MRVHVRVHSHVLRVHQFFFDIVSVAMLEYFVGVAVYSCFFLLCDVTFNVNKTYSYEFELQQIQFKPIEKTTNFIFVSISMDCIWFNMCLLEINKKILSFKWKMMQSDGRVHNILIVCSYILFHELSRMSWAIRTENYCINLKSIQLSWLMSKL